MQAHSAQEIIAALVHAYYELRDVDAALACVTEDIVWVGTESDDSAFGKAALRQLLEEDVKTFPGAFEIQLEEPAVKHISDTVANICVCGRQVEVPGVICGFTIRGTATCVSTPAGWLVSDLHVSVPNAEMEKFSLEQELSETRKKENTLMASIPGGTAIYRMKKDGRVEIEYASAGLARMLGYANYREVLERAGHNVMDSIPAEDRERVLAQVKESLRRQKPINTTFHILNKDYQSTEVRMDANVMSEAQAGTGDIAVLYAVHTLVSRAAQQAREEQNRYRMILDALEIAFVEWDEQSGLYASNRFSDYALSEQNGTDLLNNRGNWELVHPEDRALLADFLANRKNLQAGNTSVTVRLKMRDGSFRWTNMMAFVDYNSEGRHTRVIGILRDIDKVWSEQKARLEAALDEAQAANRAKTAFLSRVSHDMRTPLNGILGLTALMKDVTVNPKIVQDLAQLELSGQYLLNLINDTLDVNRIESGKLELHPTVCDSRKVMNNVIRLTQPNMEAKQILFHVEAESLPMQLIYVDEGRLQQVAMNILGNAVKFTPAGGKIELIGKNTSFADNCLVDEFWVKDNGIGISEEFLPHVFEAFSQENAETTNTNQGTGLGMAITYRLVKLMGGDMSIESTQGKGTCVRVKLPFPVATEEQIQEWKKNNQPHAANYNLHGKHVLLCEDHPLNTQIAVRLLQKVGVEVDHAENGKIGVEMFAAAAPGFYDAILMDIRMPVMDGLDATRAIRALPHGNAQTIPILAVTANALGEDVQRTQEAGMNAHISKPIEPEQLYRTLEQFINPEGQYLRQRVLVVDDVEVNRAVIRAALEPEYEVLEAESGDRALQILKEYNGMDAVVTDIQMPDMDGFELIRRIRAAEQYRRVAIIANTQYENPGQEETLLALGANDFIYKPANPKIVKIRMRNALLKI